MTVRAPEPANHALDLDRALAAHRRGDRVAARRGYEAAIAFDARNADALNLIGVLFLEEERIADAVSHARRAVALDPTNADYLNNLANALKADGRIQEARNAYESAIAADPSATDPRYNLGLLHLETREFGAAADQFRYAFDQQDGSDSRGREAWITATLLACDALGARGRWAAAADRMTRAVTDCPAAARLWARLGLIQKRCGRLGAAEDAARKALALAPSVAAVHNTLANILKDCGQIAEAIDHYRRALALAPGFAAAHSNLLLAMQYDPAAGTDSLCREADAWWRSHGDCDRVAPMVDPSADADRPLRIGFVSADFRRHAVSLFFLPLIEHLDPVRYHTVCYSDVRTPDPVTDRIRAAAGTWRPIAGCSDARVVDTILADRIDILVDLAGHTAGNRLMVFCRKPAPIQVTWLGYPDGTGLATMDYRITDAIADPPGEASGRGGEKQIRLDGGFLCYRPMGEAPDPVFPQGARDRHVTFGCFNHMAKITDPVLDAWAAILHAVPDSRLVLKNYPLGDPRVCDSVLDRFATLGIDGCRIACSGYLPDYQDHLAAYRTIDIALDTFPYNGTTTTCDALWMGVPVISLAGDRHAGRVGASLLTRVGLPELIARTADEYVACAVALAADAGRRDRLRSELRSMIAGSPLMDAVDHARQMGLAMDRIWRQWCDTQASMQCVPRPVRAHDMPDAETVRRRVAASPFWYHKIALPHGIVTPGWAPLEPAAYGIPERLDGLRVLDVGAWDGFWSFEAMHRGARSVLAIDDFSDYLGTLETRDRHAWENFDLCRELLSLDPDQCRREEISVYDLNPDHVGGFDVIFCFGTLYHLRYPLLALDRLAAVCEGDIYVESAILDDFSPYRGGLGNGYPDQAVMEFYPGAEYANNASNWWVPSLRCLTQLVGAAGFEPVRSWKLTARPGALAQCRGFVHGRKPR